MNILKLKNAQIGSVLFKVLMFSFSLTLLFTLVANLLPQVEGEAPVDVEIDLTALTMDGFVAMGETIFMGKGTCTLCHNNLGRAPDILALNMVETSNQHLADDRYTGEATSSEEYLRESMIDPGRYVVMGFGKKGSNDTESPMPIVNKAPILLTNIEMDAVIAFMQAKDGNDVTVSLPEGLPEPSNSSSSEVVSNEPPTPAVSAEDALVKFTCTACHTVAGTTSPVGPELNNVGSRLSKDEIRHSILFPDAVVAEGFDPGMMPKDFSQKMMVSELEMIIDFLSNQKGGQ